MVRFGKILDIVLYGLFWKWPQILVVFGIFCSVWVWLGWLNIDKFLQHHIIVNIFSWNKICWNPFHPNASLLFSDQLPKIYLHFQNKKSLMKPIYIYIYIYIYIDREREIVFSLLPFSIYFTPTLWSYFLPNRKNIENL